MLFTPTNWMNVWTRGFTPVSYINLKIVIRKNSQIPVKVKKKKVSDCEHFTPSSPFSQPILFGKKWLNQRTFHSSNILVLRRCLSDTYNIQNWHQANSFCSHTSGVIFHNCKNSKYKNNITKIWTFHLGKSFGKINMYINSIYTGKLKLFQYF